MPTTAMSLAAHLPSRACNRGISRRQGAHQVAQKFNTSDLPLQAEIGVDLPKLLLSEKLGICSGIFTGGRGESAKEASRSLGPGELASPAGTAIPPCTGTRATAA